MNKVLLRQLTDGAGTPIVVIDFMQFSDPSTVFETLQRNARDQPIHFVDPVTNAHSDGLTLEELARGFATELERAHVVPGLVVGVCTAASFAVHVVALQEKLGNRPSLVLVEPAWPTREDVRAIALDLRDNLGGTGVGFVEISLPAIISMIESDLRQKLSDDGVGDEDLDPCVKMLLPRYAAWMCFLLSTADTCMPRIEAPVSVIIGSGSSPITPPGWPNQDVEVHRLASVPDVRGSSRTATLIFDKAANAGKAERAELETVASLLRRHPAVAEALVTREPGQEGLTAWIVPDPNAAARLHRAARIELDGRLSGLAWYEPGPGLQVAGLNRVESDFLYREIFTDDNYLRHATALPPDAVVVDVGANIGMFALRVALLHPQAHVIAVEPVPDLANAIRVNAEVYDADITVLCTALGASEGETEFTFYRHNSVMSGRFADVAEDAAVLKLYVLTGPGSADQHQLDRVVADRLLPERARVPMSTLTSVAEQQGLDRIDLLKIDVEKGEWELLAGIAPELWPRIRRIVMEVHNIDGRLADVTDLLRCHGFVVSSDQDQRLALTPCHIVYAHRPETLTEIWTGVEPRSSHDGGPTRQELQRDLRRLLADQRPQAAMHRITVVGDLNAARLHTLADATIEPPTGSRRTAVLTHAWAALFGADAVRPDADFFELGGTSLLALRLMDRVDQELGAGALTPEMIFGEASFGALAAALEAGRPADDGEPGQPDRRDSQA